MSNRITKYLYFYMSNRITKYLYFHMSNRITKYLYFHMSNRITKYLYFHMSNRITKYLYFHMSNRITKYLHFYMSNRITNYLYLFMSNRITNYCYFFRYKQDYLHSLWTVLLITWTYSYCYLKSYSQIKEKWKLAIILWIGDKALANQISTSTYQPTGWPKIIDQGTAESRPGLLHKGKGWKLPYLWIN